MGRRAVRYLVDSVILIDHFNGIEDATRFLSEHGAECAISVIARAEALTGFDDAMTPVARTLLDRFETLPVTIEIGDQAARMRRAHRWKLPDALQAATATAAGLTLVTRDARAFGTSDAVSVLVPYAAPQR